MLFAGAAFFAPHAGLPLPKPSGARPSAMAHRLSPLVAEVTTTETFWLPVDYAYEGLIGEAAEKYGLDADLIRAVIRTESAFDASALSSAGAQGLMQLMPALAEELGVVNAFDPRENIMAGSQYLSLLLNEHNGDVELALASYNAGPGAVEFYQGIPPFQETQRYVRTIVGLLKASAP